jgi:AraC-like DNA-binding protein
MATIGRNQNETAIQVPTVVALVKRERTKALVRAAFPRRRAHVALLKSFADLEDQITKQLVDAVLIDAGAGDDALRVIARAEEFQSIPFVLITPLLPNDAPLLARAIDAGVAEILIDTVDDSVARELVIRNAFSTRFARALIDPPPILHLDTPMQLAVWRSVVQRAGRTVRTDQLAKELGVSREHLSRSFAVGEAPTLKRVIDLVRVLAAAELAKNAGFDVRDVAKVLGFASSSHLSSTTQRLVGARASSLTRLRTIDLLDRFQQQWDDVPHGSLD